jgi:cellulose synthase/poly-beta-1,6-N-acetylglucosamine synthase-like glycosyltransferase
VPPVGHPLSVSLLDSALVFAGALALMAARARLGPVSTALAVHLVAACVTWLLLGPSVAVALPLAVGLALAVTANRMLPDFTVPGRVLLAAHIQLLMSGLIWGVWFLATIPVSPLTRTLLFAGCPLLLITLPSGLIQLLEQNEVLWRARWRRPRAPAPVGPGHRYPKVSLHVPAYAEPPEVVIATLDALAQLHYPNFEVLVIDNNTPDPSLWRPVQAHCRRLGERFRFFHVDRLPGAKAGALNFALRHTAADAELIGVVDSDYLADPDWLSSVVGYFDDPRMGFVQAPHDYRDWESSPYLRMCYWEYQLFFKTTMVSLNERDAALTVGTMCLIRRKALEDAGGWAEWCATEDSELAIRIHAQGYSSVYLTTSFGRGLIPETFAGYKKQRFRWTCGPVQELKHHLRLFLPGLLGRRSALSVAQTIHHFNHGVDRLNVGVGLLLVPLGLAVIASMLLQHEVVQVPLEMWLAATVLLPSGYVLQWLTYRTAVGCSVRDMLGAMLASAALHHTIATASLRALLTQRIPWYRTSKFSALPLGLGALGDARTELLLAVFTIGAAGFAIARLPQPGLHLMLLIGAILQGTTYLAAPLLALLAERDVHARRVADGHSLLALPRRRSVATVAAGNG